MPNNKTITKNETYSHNQGQLKIHVWSGNAHSTDLVVEKNGSVIVNGTDDIQINTVANTGNKIFVEARIYRTTGSSSHVNLCIALFGSSEVETYEYHSIEPEFDIVIYHVTIQLV